VDVLLIILDVCVVHFYGIVVYDWSFYQIKVRYQTWENIISRQLDYNYDLKKRKSMIHNNRTNPYK